MVPAPSLGAQRNQAQQSRSIIPETQERSVASRRSPAQSESRGTCRSAFDHLNNQGLSGVRYPNAQEVHRAVAPNELRNRHERRYDVVQRQVEEHLVHESSRESSRW